MRYLPLLLCGLTLLLNACATPRDHAVRPVASAAACSQPLEFIVLQLNDVYETSPLDGGRVGGMARVATILKQLEQKNPNTIAVMAGDFLSPSLIGSLKKKVGEQFVPIAGEQMVAVMNAAGIDYVTFGNHEFDIPLTSLQSRLDESEFSYISANVLNNTATGPKPFRQVRNGKISVVPEYLVHEFTRSGCQPVRLGLIGLTLPFNQKGYVYYQDVFASAQRSFAAASAESDLVFALTHLSIDMDRQLAGAIPELPLIMGGHEHEDMKVISGRTHITKADANARTVYIHWVTYHPGSGEVDIWSQLMPVTEDIRGDEQVASVIQQWENLAGSAISDMGFDPAGVVARFRQPYDGREASVRNRATNLGQAIACAMLSEDDNATFALLGSGSIRVDDMLSGTATQRDVLRTLPFGGPIVHGSFKGSVLKRILKIGLHDNRGEGGYLQTTPNVIERDDSFFINGVAVEDSKDYETVLNEFLTLGKEQNLEFMATEGKYKTLTLTGVDGGKKNDIRDVTIRYLKSKTGNWEQCS